ncbi:MAG: CrcB family protein [Algisphaera sp.]
MPRILPILLLATGGALGALARVGLAATVQRLHGGPWPVGTFVANALGCLLFGLIMGAASAHGRWSPAVTMALLGGFCGAFTTFSTFAHDAVRTANGAGLMQAAGVLMAHIVVGVGLMTAGLWLGGRLGGA